MRAHMLSDSYLLDNHIKTTVQRKNKDEKKRHMFL